MNTQTTFSPFNIFNSFQQYVFNFLNNFAIFSLSANFPTASSRLNPLDSNIYKKASERALSIIISTNPFGLALSYSISSFSANNFIILTTFYRNYVILTA